jgi:site-specific DNA-methyltransferase (adenine-specific)
MTSKMPRGRLWEGDCLIEMKRLRAASVHMVLCDLPYGVTDCRWDRKIDLDALWREYRRVLAPGGAVVLFAQGAFAAELLTGIPRTWFRYELVWDKAAASGWLNARRLPMRAHELLLVFGRRLRYEPQGLKACAWRLKGVGARGFYRGTRPPGRAQTETGFATSMLRFARKRGAKPCEKPVELLEWAIRSYTRPGETVLDNAMGLGSTGVAAIRAGRRFVGVEIDPERFRVARARIRQERRDLAGGRLLEDGPTA